MIDYTREDFADREQRWDTIIDIGGNSSLARLRRARHPEGRWSSSAARPAGVGSVAPDACCGAPLLSLFVRQGLGVLLSKENYEDIVVLTDLIEAGKVMPAVDRIYPLAEAPKAIRHLVEGKARGKVVIRARQGTLRRHGFTAPEATSRCASSAAGVRILLRAASVVVVDEATPRSSV